MRGYTTNVGFGGNARLNAGYGLDMGESSEITVRAKYGGAIYLYTGQGDSTIGAKLDSRGLNKKPNAYYYYYGEGGENQVGGRGDIVFTGKMMGGADGGGEDLYMYGCRVRLEDRARFENINGSPENGAGVQLTAYESFYAGPQTAILADAQGGGEVFIDVRTPDKPPVLLGSVVPPAEVGYGGGTSDCAVCGNGEIDYGESCDDGNTTSGDNCRDDCQDEGCLAESPTYPVDPLCDDGDACTVDTCDPVGHTCVNTVSCEEGVACTIDSCVASACEHTPDDSACDDNNDCTDDICNGTTGCQHANLTGNSCEDGDLCTLTGTCDSGSCVATDEVFASGSKATFRFKEGPDDDRAVFKTNVALTDFTTNPTATGMLLLLRDGDNQTILGGDIPSTEFVDKAGTGISFTFKDKDGAVASADGIVSVKIKKIVSKGVAKITAKVKDREMPGADGEFRVSVSILFGTDPAVDECITARFIPCDPQPGKNKCKE